MVSSVSFMSPEKIISNAFNYNNLEISIQLISLISSVSMILMNEIIISKKQKKVRHLFFKKLVERSKRNKKTLDRSITFLSIAIISFLGILFTCIWGFSLLPLALNIILLVLFGLLFLIFGGIIIMFLLFLSQLRI